MNKKSIIKFFIGFALALVMALGCVFGISLWSNRSEITASADEVEYTKGDVDGDGEITLKDVIMLRQYLSGAIKLTFAQIQAGDVYGGDNKVELNDIVRLEQYVAEIPVKFEYACDHSFSVTTVAATCTEKGSTTYTCSKCGYEYTEYTADALRHTYGEWSVETPPDATTEGELKRTCGRDSSHVETKTLPAFNTTDYVYTVTTAAECTTDGVGAYTYTVGEQTFTFTVTIKAEGHTYTDGTCEVCGAEYGSDGLAYTISDDKTYYTVSGLGTCSDTEVYIPSEYNGLPVTAIGDGAFKNCNSIVKITIRNNITVIGEKAFENCAALVKITIGTGLSSIGDGAFKGCVKLVDIAISSENAYFTYTDGALYNIKITILIVYIDCTAKSFTLPETVTEVKPYAFSTGTTVETVDLNKAETIRENAFCGNTTIISVIIPVTVTVIGENAFDGCTSIKHYCYGGSTEEWNKVTVPSELKVVIEINIYYYSEEAKPASEGKYWNKTVVNIEITIVIVVVTHESEYVPAVAATCTEAGNIAYYKCKNCGNYYSDESCTTEITDKASVIISALRHDYVSHEAKAATCTEIGWESYETCSRCDYSTYKEIPATDHTEVIDEAVAATCTATGLTEGKHCSVCGTVLVAQETVAATDHSYDEGVITTAPTCTEKGVKTYTCKNGCGNSYTTYISPTGHSYVTEVVSGLTCTEDGVIKYTCADCKDTYTVTTPASHSYAITAIENSDCENDGKITYTCSVCGDEYYETIPAGSHNYVGVITKKATATEEGVITYTCSNCGNSYTEVIPVKGVGVSVLLIQDSQPWTANSNTSLLSDLVTEGYIADWTLATTSTLSEYTLEDYGIIYIANEQTTAVYTALAAYNTELENYVKAGGVLIYGACDHGWRGGNISSLPDGITKSNYYSRYNYIVDYSHAVVTGELTDNVGLTNELLYGTYCSHTSFGNLPAGANIILQDGKGNPTLVEYTLGEGTMILSGLTWEFYYIRNIVGNTSYAKNVFDDLIIYAATLTGEMCTHEYDGDGTVYAPTCTETGYTLHTCLICGKQFKDSYVAALGHTYDDGVITTAATCTTAGVKTYTCTVCGATKTEEIAATGHTYNDGVVTTEPTCEGAGVMTYTCTVCKATKTEVKEKLSHDCTETVVSPTCTEQGYTLYECTRCDYSYKDTYTSALSHNYVNGVCTRCGEAETVGATYTRCDENGNASSTGKYVKFGSYPQTKVSDSSLITTLNLEAGTLPTSSNSQKWTSYNYYISSSSSTDYMWYIDVTYSGSTYRGVYFTSYRPYYTGYSSSTSYTYQDDNGYYTSTVYWFKYEPILWRILSESDDTALILSETLIDSQQYYWNYTSSKVSRSAVDNYNDDYYAGSGTTSTSSAYANNYKYSDIRAWLNETFYNTAFGATEKSLIQTTTVDNSAASTTDYNGNLTKATSYYCADTNDKVFLLSEYEVTNTAYGFASYSTYDTARRKQSSDYAKSQGCWASTSSSYLGCGWWWLRSPHHKDARGARNVYNGGGADVGNGVSGADGGVAPALNIRL